MLNRRFMMQKKVKDENSWDYEWSYVPGGDYPPNMTYETVEDTGEGLLIKSGQLAFSDNNGTGYSELFVRATFILRFKSPQYIIAESYGNGFKVYPGSSTVLNSNCGGTAQGVYTPLSDVESVRMIFKDGVASVYVNESLVTSGPGVKNNNYLYYTGIYNPDSASQVFKEIKFRRL